MQAIQKFLPFNCLKNFAMRVFFILLHKELRSFFWSPIAWVVLALVMLLNGFSFAAAMTNLETGLRSTQMVVYTFNSLQFWLAYFFVFPVITMRLFAEEQKLGTIETLLTAPVTTWQVIFAKYAAALIFYCILWLPSFFNFVLFQAISGEGASVIGSMTGSYLIIALVGIFNIAIGLFASAITANQLVAAMSCFTGCLLHFLLGYFLTNLRSDVAPQFQGFIDYFSTFHHVPLFLDGLVDSRPVVYYLSFAFLILFFTHHVLDYRKWKA